MPDPSKNILSIHISNSTFLVEKIDQFTIVKLIINNVFLDGPDFCVNKSKKFI